jgi:hypothetical protein
LPAPVGPTRANRCRRLTRFDQEVHVSEDGGAWFVRQMNAGEPNLPSKTRRRLRTVRNLGDVVEYVGDPLQGARGLARPLRRPRELPERPVEAVHVRGEDDELPRRQASGDHLGGTEEERRRRRHPEHEFHPAVEPGAQSICLQAALEAPPVHAAQPLVFLVLTGEHLH